jgi:hypothetical protein
METKTKIWLILLFINLFSFTTLFAQPDTTAVYQITLKDDSEFIGKIINETDQFVIIKTLIGTEIKIEIAIIVERKLIEEIWRSNEFLRSDPNKTRLFFSPTGRMLKAGQGYFSEY